MLFNSVEYFYFLLGVVALYFALPFRFRWALLLVASYVFYMSWNPAYVVLILTATVVNYWAAQKITQAVSPRSRRWTLDVLVVGARSTGLAAAAELVRHGLSVRRRDPRPVTRSPSDLTERPYSDVVPEGSLYVLSPGTR